MSFDPIAYHKDVVAHPENYVRCWEIVWEAQTRIAMRGCNNLEALKRVFEAAWRESNPDRLKSRTALKEVYDKRKTELS